MSVKSLLESDSQDLQDLQDLRSYMKRGWLKIYSAHIDEHFYVVRDKDVDVPDKSLPVVDRRFVDVFNTSLLNIMTLYDTAKIFQRWALDDDGDGNDESK